MEIKGSTLLKKSDDLIEAGLGESLALMSIESGKYFGMNQVASYIWQAMNEEVSFDDLVSRLTSVFEVDTETCANNCKDFIQDLHERKMVLAR
ncbi:MAG: PqqD family protein [Roseivirga sp.]|nr:PqqD family protein [Roseivirga sp.]